MKNIENYVCTLEQAEKLRMLGINKIAKESLFVWVKGLIPQTEPEREGWTVANMTDMREAFYEADSFLLAAFTSQELGELIVKELGPFTPFTQSIANESMFYFILSEQDHVKYNYDSEAHARAQFLIDRLERKRRK